MFFNDSVAIAWLRGAWTLELAAQDPDGFSIGKTIQVTAPEKTNAVWPLLITGIASTGDAEDNAIFVPLSFAQAYSGHPSQLRQLFVSALTKPADALAVRDPHSLTPVEYDRWFCSPYISSISYQIEQVLAGTDVHAIRRVAETEGRVLTRVSTLLWIVTIAALLAAALAVGATAATTVLERRGEIGIMKAIGATNFAVTALFLAEQLLLAVVGGALGFVLGAGLGRVLGTSVFGTPAAPRLVLLPIVLGIAALVLLLRLFKQTPVQEIPIGVPVGRLVAKQNGNGNGNGNGHGRFGEEFEPQPGVVTVEVLNRLIKENPANMTQAIRDWMNKGRTSEN